MSLEGKPIKKMPSRHLNHRASGISVHHFADPFAASPGRFFIHNDVMTVMHDKFRLLRELWLSIIVLRVIKVRSQGAGGTVFSRASPPHAVKAIAEPGGNDGYNESCPKGIHGSVLSDNLSQEHYSIGIVKSKSRNT